MFKGMGEVGSREEDGRMQGQQNNEESNVTIRSESPSHPGCVIGLKKEFKSDGEACTGSLVSSTE